MGTNNVSPFGSDFFGSGGGDLGATTVGNVGSTSPSPSAPTSPGEFDPLQARARLDRGETLEQVAGSYGITPRALKVRMTKLRTQGSPHAAARAAIGETAYTGPGIPAEPAPAAPTAEQLEIERAIADFRKYITPDAIVESIDGVQSGITQMGLYLLEAPVTEKEAAMIPYDDLEKKMLRPWASFSLANIETALRANPSLGIQLFFLMIGLMSSRRALIVMVAAKRRKLLKREKAHTSTLAQETPPQGKAEENARL